MSAKRAPAANFESAATPEVWAEIDRLRAINADLLLALQQIAAVNTNVDGDRFRFFALATADLAISKAMNPLPETGNSIGEKQ
jgi:hypothetical protein